jgi:hypothetical protein
VATARPRSARRGQRPWKVSGWIALAALFGAGNAYADDAEQTAAARSFGVEGVRLAESGDCAHAIDPLSRAEALHHAPTTLERLGECHIAVGKIVVGTEELNRVIREPLPPGAPAAFTAAQARAKAALDPALAKIGKLRIHVEHPPQAAPQVKVDDDVVAGAMLDADRPTDPGPHTISVSAAGMKPVQTALTLADGQSQSVSLTLEPDPNAVAAATPAPAIGAATGTPLTPPPGEPPPAEAPTQAKSKVPMIVAYGVGGAGIVVGAIFGIVALGKQSSLNNECPTKACNPSAQGDIDSLNSTATISTVGFGVGIVGAAVGTVLLLTSGGGHSSAASSSHPASARITPYFGPGTAGLTGSF